MRNADVDEEVRIGGIRFTRTDGGLRRLAPRSVLTCAVSVAAVSLFAAASGQGTRVRTIELPAAPGPLTNPLKGYAPWTTDGPPALPTSMAYVDASWKELEPSEGDYRFAEWEKKKWDAPEAKGKHIVFRVWMDYPNQPSGVPAWLVSRGVKMTSYTDFGGGKSPDYEDPTLKQALLRLIRKLGERYDSNPRVAFIQVGLLGHWGEFHTYPRPELFASEETQRRVVTALHEAFPHKQLMARNPAYPSLRLPWLGFHDDMIPEDTLPPEDWKFLPGLRANKLDSNWKVAPTGGEMVPGAAAKWLGEGWDDTQRAVKETHFSWLGPYCPAMAGSSNATFRQRAEDLIRLLGYEYRLTSFTAPVSMAADANPTVKVTGVNQGVAPFYYPWKVEIVLLDGVGNVAARSPVDVDIREWLPGTFQFRAPVPKGVAPGTYRLAIGIIDPWTEKPAIAFANRLPQSAGYTILNSIAIGKRGT